MKIPVRPELPTASVGSSQAPTAAVDNSAPSAIRPESTYKSGKVVQTNGATSNTGNVREPLFTIVNVTNGERLAVIGASSPEKALEYCERLERELDLPAQREQLQAVYLEPGTPITGVEYYSSSFFQLLDQLDAGEFVCPMCGQLKMDSL